MTEAKTTIIWIKYVFNGDVIEVNIAPGSLDEDVEKIEMYAPGVAHVVRKHGIVDIIVAGEMQCRAKTDQQKIEVPKIVLPS